MSDDRGDDFIPTGEDVKNDVIDKPLDKPLDKPADDVKDLPAAKDDKPADDKPADDEQPRGNDGKFAKKSDGDGQMIPKARVDEMVKKEGARADAAEAKANELAQQIKAVGKSQDLEKTEGEIKDLEAAQAKAIVDGDHEKAAAIMGQIRHKERQVQIDSSKTMSTQAKEQAREEIRLDLTIERLEVEYPMLSEISDKYDADAVDMVLATQRQLMEMRGMSASQALAEAAKKVMAKITVVKDDGDGDKVDKPSGLDKAKTVADRTQAQIDKNLETDKKQPASLKDTGLDSDKKGISENIDVSKLSYEEFGALPEATKARLRGDDA